LDGDERRRRMDDIRGRVKAAERDGKFEDALRWMAELSRLEADAAATGG